MARPTAFSKFLIVVIALGLIGFGLQQFGILNNILPKPKPKDSISSDDFAGIDDNKTPSTPAPTNEPLKESSKKLDRPIRVGIVTWPGYTGGIVANNGAQPNKDCIYWNQYGIEVEFIIIEDTAQNRQAFTSGNTDIMWSTTDFFASEHPGLLSSGTEGKIILMNDWSRGGDGIVVKPGINRIEDLINQKIAVTQYTPSHFFLLYLLAKSNLTTQDVDKIRNDLVYVASAPDAAKAFMADQVDAAVTWEPDLTFATRGGKGKKLVTTKTVTNLIADVMIARTDFIQEYPSEVKAFVSGWFDGVDKFYENKEVAYRVVAKALSLDYETTKDMTEGIRVTTYGDNREFFNIETGSQAQSPYESIFQSASTIWRKEGVITQVSRPWDAADTRFLQTMLKDRPGEIVTEEFDFTDTAPANTDEALLSKTLRIHFATGSSTLDPNAKVLLDDFGETLITIGNAYVKVEGHTDNVGSRTSNIRLSKQRAQSVVDYLVQKFNISKQRFRVQGMGPDRPIASNDTEEGKSQNRRTEFFIIPAE